MAQRVPNILVCDYSRVCSCYSKFIRVRSYFLGFSSSIVRTRIARGCQAATRTTAVCGVLYAASDFFVMAVVVPLLVALDGIHHRAGSPRAQFHCHADAVGELPGLQVSSSACPACLAAISFRTVTPVRAISTICVRGTASDQAFGATCCSTTAVNCAMLEAACFLVCSLLLIVL